MEIFWRMWSGVERNISRYRGKSGLFRQRIITVLHCLLSINRRENMDWIYLFEDRNQYTMMSHWLRKM